MRYRNSFQTNVEATFLPVEGQTRILCRFGLHRFVTAFMTIWFGGMVLIGGSVVALSVRELLTGVAEPELGLEASVLGLVPAALLVFGYGLLRFGRWLARNEQDFLIDFLCTTLEARKVGERVKGEGTRQASP